MTESAQLSNREHYNNILESIDYYVGQHVGDVYLTGLDLFSRFTYPRNAGIFFRDDLDYVSGGANPDGDVGVWIGLQPGTLTASMRSRINERFGLSKEQQIDGVYMPFIFAHELGHAVQRDPEFEIYFGKQKDDYTEPEEDYESYVNSHDELNADYIAAVILGNSELGKLIGYMPPKEPPIDWRTWAEQHPIPNTIALQKSS